MRPPRIEYPVVGLPAPSRLPPMTESDSRIETFSPGSPASRIMKAAAASDPMPPPTRYAFGFMDSLRDDEHVDWRVIGVAQHQGAERLTWQLAAFALWPA